MKLRSQKGETLIETLAALLIATLVLAFLANSVVAATKLNAAVRDKDDFFRYSVHPAQSTLKLTVKGANYTETIPVTECQEENGFRRYSQRTGGAE